MENSNKASLKIVLGSLEGIVTLVLEIYIKNTLSPLLVHLYKLCVMVRYNSSVVHCDYAM